MNDQAPDSFRSIGAISSGIVAKLEADRHRVAKPGFFQMPAVVYHSDPCPDPSLSNSIAKTIIRHSPRHAWVKHPRLNPQFVVDQKAERKIEIANVAHARFLRAGADRIEIIDGDDYRAKEPKAERAAAYAADRLPILLPDHNIAVAMVAVARLEFANYPEFSAVLDEGAGFSEMIAAWHDEETWCRAMLDRVSTDLRIVLDYKTTGNAHPEACAARIADNYFQMQPAFYTRGLDALDPDGRGRRKFFFLYQEQEEPYACSVHELDGNHRAIGERQVEAALHIWKRCRETNVWPSYPRQIHRVEMKPWLEQNWLNREIADPSIDISGISNSSIEAPARSRMLTDLAGG